MADGHGGYRRPSNPAPTSGPGKLSKRTDGGPADKRQPQRDLPDAAYGERKAMREIQGGAPMSGGAPAPAAAPVDPRAGVVPLSAPTMRPDEPVTAGNPLGPGVGPEAAGIDVRTPDQQDAEHLKNFVPLLVYMANQPDASPTTRMLARELRSRL